MLQAWRVFVLRRKYADRRESPEAVEATLRDVRRMLPSDVALWIGGKGIAGCSPIRGVDRIENDQRLEAFVLEARGNEDREGAA